MLWSKQAINPSKRLTLFVRWYFSVHWRGKMRNRHLRSSRSVKLRKMTQFLLFIVWTITDWRLHPVKCEVWMLMRKMSEYVNIGEMVFVRDDDDTTATIIQLMTGKTTSIAWSEGCSHGAKDAATERRMQPARGRFARFDLDRQIASTFPAHWKVGPAPVFWASQPLEPAEWLALLILKAGDVESNPGPQNRKLPPSALTTQTTTHLHATTSHPNQKLLTLLQLNINCITNKHEELKLLVTELQPDIITIQETKLKKHNKTPQIPTYLAIRTDRANGKGGGLLTYIKHNITFSDTKIPNFINPINTELQIIQLHITHTKIYTIANIYIPPRNITSPDHATCDADITSCIQYITNLPNSIISGDINAHSSIWHSHTTDHRGDLIADLLGNSDHITLNTNTHTRLPFAANQRATSPDITSITTNLYNRTHWETLNALNSDHLPILTTINTRTNFRLQQNRQTYTNYNKANWQNFTTETESSFRNINPPSDTHTANKILTNIIHNADKHNISKGKIQNNCKLLPEDIRTKINTRNNIRKHNPLDRNLAQLNNEITSDIQHHKTALWKSHLDGNWDHRENTHTLWKTLKNLSNKKMHTNKNHAISFNNKPSVTSTQIANSFNKQFTNTVPHTSNKTNRNIDKQVHKLPKTTFILTTSEISAAIRNSKNNNSTGPDGISIKHLKNIGPLGLTYLTNTFNLALNTNTIPHMWKLANIIPILKPDKDHNTGTSFRPISLLSVISKTLEKALLPYITNNIPQHHTQHGFKAKHSTTTALHNMVVVSTQSRAWARTGSQTPARGPPSFSPPHVKQRSYPHGVRPQIPDC